MQRKEYKKQSDRIAICYARDCKYPQDRITQPDEFYPEYPFDKRLGCNETNYVYSCVREAFHLLGLDNENYGSTNWNPLKNYVHSGDTVLIKPNLVMEYNASGNSCECLFTQAAVIAPIIDYVYIALNGIGKIIIADAPVQECNFEKLIKESGYLELLNVYTDRGIDISVKDLRNYRSHLKKGLHVGKVQTESKGIVVDLKKDSEFADLSEQELKSLRITNYDPKELSKHHSINKHEYFIAYDVLSANVVINVPKPKTHRKAGVTIGMKNIVGISCRKEYLPHHRNGSLAVGGDSYLNKSFLKSMKDILLDDRNLKMQKKIVKYVAQIESKIISVIDRLGKKVCKDPYYEGSWYGNDTISRSIVDLNKILIYADSNGIMKKIPQRTVLNIGDLIVSGEGDGPLRPSPIYVGAIAVGEDIIAFDRVLGRFMGIKDVYFSTLNRAKEYRGKYKFGNTDNIPIIMSNNQKVNGILLNDISEEDLWGYLPTEGWKKGFVKQNREF